MSSSEYSGINFSYGIDADHRFVCISDGMLEMYPGLKVGQVCHQAIYEQDEPCAVCPLKEPHNKELTVFNPVIDEWVNVMCVDMDWPTAGKCTLLVCSIAADVENNIKQRIPYLAGYDVFIEMNLTRNKFRRFFKGAKVDEVPYEEKSLSALLEHTEKDIVHPLDQERFRSFWDIKTLMGRLRAAGDSLHEEFVEKNARGTFDIVHITIVPSGGLTSQEDVVLAMYTIIRSPELASIALTSDGAANVAQSDIHAVNSGAMEAILDEGKFVEAVDNVIERAEPGECCLLYLDMEHFRFFNRWLGREAGTNLLEAIAGFLLNTESLYNGIPCHISADKFACLLPFDRQIVDTVAQRVRDIVDESADGMKFRMAQGVYLFEKRGVSVEDAIDNARTAARRSLRTADQVGPCWYDEWRVEEIEQRMHSAAEINDALDKGQFAVFFQPKCICETGQIIGAEALARWQHPERGIIGPGAFVPILEEDDNISKLDVQIWHQAFAAVRRMLDEGINVPPVSVNVSRRDIDAVDVVAQMKGLAQEFALNPEMIEIELTESALAGDDGKLLEAIGQLRADGFNVSIDDFGSGYSSLNMLKDIPADALKVDLKFIDFTEENTSKAVSIVHSVIEMAHTLGIPVVVEGVETDRQAKVLSDLDCHYIQGYLYHKPMPLHDFEQLLSANDEMVIEEGLIKHYATTSKRLDNNAQSEFDDTALNALTTPVVMYELDANNDINIIKYNEPFLKLIGSDELLRRKNAIQNYTVKQDVEKLYSALHRALENPHGTAQCHVRFCSESGELVPLFIIFSFANSKEDSHCFLGLLSVCEHEGLEGAYASDFTLIDKQWLDASCEVGVLNEKIVEGVSGAVALYYFKDGELYLKGGNRALLSIFGETEQTVKQVPDRDVLSRMSSENISSLFNAMQQAVSKPGNIVLHDTAFSRRSDSKLVKCRIGICYVREFDDGQEFILSVSALD